MRSLFALCLTVILGCSAEVNLTDQDHTKIDSNDNSLPPNGTDQGMPCPAPLVFHLLINGKEEVRVMNFPCSSPTPNTSPASDPPGWGSDDQSSHSNSNIPMHEPRHDPVVDPVPHKF